MDPHPLIAPGLFALLVAIRLERSRRKPRVERVLLFGTGPIGREVLRELEDRPELRCAVVGVVDDAEPPAAGGRAPFLGPPERLAQIAQELRPHRIIVGKRPGGRSARELLHLRVSGLIVEDAAHAYERLTGKMAIDSLRPASLLACEGFRSSRLQQVMARAISVLFAVVGLISLSPLLALIAAAIRLESEGPVLFRQRRLGLCGKPFELLKFRTMRAASRPTSEWVGDNRERITRVGAWLRRFRCDELPQLVNILVGEMNLVGPRPHPLSNFKLFARRIPFYALRCLVRPGLTGWAQVRYRYANNLAEEIEKMRYDLYYIKHRSALLDLRIIPETVKAILTGGAAAEAKAASPSGPRAVPGPGKSAQLDGANGERKILELLGRTRGRAA